MTVFNSELLICDNKTVTIFNLNYKSGHYKTKYKPLKFKIDLQYEINKSCADR